jgi:hypothetical protein
MNGRAKTCWRAIEARPTGSDDCVGVPRGLRLAALYRLQNGEALGGLRLVDPVRAVPMTDPADIDWTGFPVLEALEAVARDELRLLRNLLDETPPAHPVERPREDMWGIDLRRATSSGL